MNFSWLFLFFSVTDNYLLLCYCNVNVEVCAASPLLF